MLDLEKIKNELLDEGFYNIITSSCTTTNNNNKCANRLDQVTRGIIPDTLFETIKTTCRIGRDINCVISECNSESKNKCPICYFSNTNEKIQTVCTGLDKFKSYKLDDTFILIPNAFPYLDNHFLITVPTHSSQFEIMNTLGMQLLYNINKLLRVNPTGVIFFNGMCGNSLEHFHCQITTTDFPIFKYVPQNNGLIDKDGFRGWFITFSYENKSEFSDMLDKLKESSYNFILKKNNNIFQCIFFVRKNCETVQPNLNLGSTELSGILGSNTDTFPDKTKLYAYLDETNNLSNYLFLQNQGGNRKSRRNRKIKKSRKGKSSKNRRKSNRHR